MTVSSDTNAELLMISATTGDLVQEPVRVPWTFPEGSGEAASAARTLLHISQHNELFIGFGAKNRKNSS